MVDVVLFDLDGVVRKFSNSQWPEIPPVAFDPGLLDQAVTGQITDEQWRAEVLRRLGPGSADAVAEWSASCGEVNHAVLDIVRAARAAVRVGLLTNGTSRLAADLEVLGIAGEFDVIFNSAEIGVAKPDVAVYRLACDRLATVPERVFFVDDSPGHVDGAREAGMQACLFVDAVLLTDSLRSEGLPVGEPSR
jgi:putative hydrolase of the HAD superfamily